MVSWPNYRLAWLCQSCKKLSKSRQARRLGCDRRALRQACHRLGCDRRALRQACHRPEHRLGRRLGCHSGRQRTLRQLTLKLAHIRHRTTTPIRHMASTHRNTAATAVEHRLQHTPNINPALPHRRPWLLCRPQRRRQKRLARKAHSQVQTAIRQRRRRLQAIIYPRRRCQRPSDQRSCLRPCCGAPQRSLGRLRAEHHQGWPLVEHAHGRRRKHQLRRWHRPL